MLPCQNCKNNYYKQRLSFIIAFLTLLQSNIMNSNRPSRTNILEKALLKAIIPFVVTPQDQKSPFLLLGRISAVSFSHKTGKEKKPKCTICGAVYQNYLLFVLHVELIHNDQFEVDKYEFSQDLLVIYYREPGKRTQNHQKYLQAKERNMFLLQSFEVRAKQILERISGKFVKKFVKQKQQYYHSYDIFKQIRPQSEDEDSEEDVAYIQRELQKLRMGEFTDISEQDKLFFISWNKAIHQARSIHVILGKEQILEVLTNFTRTAKEQGIKRLNLVMHAWTLWSSGIINSQDVCRFLQSYDDIQ